MCMCNFYDIDHISRWDLGPHIFLAHVILERSGKWMCECFCKWKIMSAVTQSQFISAPQHIIM